MRTIIFLFVSGTFAQQVPLHDLSERSSSSRSLLSLKHLAAHGHDGRHLHAHSRHYKNILIGSNTSTSAGKCAMERLLCKVPSSECMEEGQHLQCVRPIFITGTAGSGTHFVADFLAKISGRGIKVRHEGPGLSPEVLVSWASRCPRHVKEVGGESVTDRQSSGSKQHRQQRPMRLKFDGLFPSPDDSKVEKYLKQPMVKWAEDQISGACAYRHVIHLVRHPLRFLSSNFAFGQCVECWTLVERLSVPSLLTYTAEVRQIILANRRRLYKQTGGRTWDGPTRAILLGAFARYWISWNSMIERVADRLVKLEDGPTVLRAVCVDFKLGTRQECQRNVKLAAVKKASHGGGLDKVTWQEIGAISGKLEGEVWQMAHRFGYGRDPPPALD